jgi:hypothetical protein
MGSVVHDMLSRIFESGENCNVRDLELFRETKIEPLIGKLRSCFQQEVVHQGSLAFVSLLNLLEQEITSLLQLAHHISQFHFLFLLATSLLEIMISVKVLVISLRLIMLRTFLVFMFFPVPITRVLFPSRSRLGLPS